MAIVAGSAALLAWNTARWTAHTDYGELAAHRRLWSDLADAVNVYLDHRFQRGADVQAGDAGGAYGSVVRERIARGQIRPWQFWRTIGPRAFLPHRVLRPASPYDDPGRGMVLGAGFRVLGGVSPFLILWLGMLLCLPVLAWTVWEFVDAGRGVAGGVFASALACSPYFVEALALTRYAVGFYLLALLAVVALAVYALLGRPTARGLVARTLAAGVWLALCALCRSSVVLLLPGFAFALWMAVRRVTPPRGGRLLLVAAAVLCLAAPFLLVRQPEHHGLWSALWEGLGDFDREKGHAWSDPVAERVSVSGGGGPLWTPGSEALFRRLVLHDVREDPLWYARILLKRVAATVTQWKLWAWRPRDGTPIRPRTSWNEGFIDKYYGYTATVDHVGLGPWRVELPITVLLLPALLLVVVAWRERGFDEARRLRACLVVMAAVALATLPVPVLVSTAAAQEKQAFALTYVLGAAFLVEELWRRRPALLRRGAAPP